MCVEKVREIMDRGIQISSRTMSSIGGGFLLLMVALTVADVFLRYVFNRPILGSIELTECMVVVLGCLGLAWCEVNNGHIRVNLLVPLLPGRMRAIVDSLTTLCSLFVYLIITWCCFRESYELKGIGQTTDILKLPVYPFYVVMAFGAAMLCLALFRSLMKFMREAVKR